MGECEYKTYSAVPRATYDQRVREGADPVDALFVEHSCYSPATEVATYDNPRAIPHSLNVCSLHAGYVKEENLIDHYLHGGNNED